MSQESNSKPLSPVHWYDELYEQKAINRGNVISDYQTYLDSFDEPARDINIDCLIADFMQLFPLQDGKRLKCSTSSYHTFTVKAMHVSHLIQTTGTISQNEQEEIIIFDKHGA